VAIFADELLAVTENGVQNTSVRFGLQVNSAKTKVGLRQKAPDNKPSHCQLTPWTDKSLFISAACSPVTTAAVLKLKVELIEQVKHLEC